MRTIYSPSSNSTGRWEECAEALEPAFMQLVDRAQQAGWCKDEVREALIMLARLAAENTSAAPPANQSLNSRLGEPLAGIA